MVKIINKGLEFIGKAAAERGGASGEGSTGVGRPGGVARPSWPCAGSAGSPPSPARCPLDS